MVGGCASWKRSIVPQPFQYYVIHHSTMTSKFESLFTNRASPKDKKVWKQIGICSNIFLKVTFYLLLILKTNVSGGKIKND